MVRLIVFLLLTSVTVEILAESPASPSLPEAEEAFETKPFETVVPQLPRQKFLTEQLADGLRLSSADESFKYHIGGNIQVDSVSYLSPSSAFSLPNGTVSGIGGADATFLRRARIRIDGTFYAQFDYMLEYDFANANNENNGLQPPSFGNIAISPAPTNVWMQVRDVPVFGSLRAGNQVKPVGFTSQVYQGFLPFLERADIYDAFFAGFDNGFSIGVSARDHSDDERVTWQYGIYRPLTNAFGIALNKVAWGGRVTALPVYENEGERLVHLGFGTFNGNLPENQLRDRARPLLRNGPGYANPILVDTGNVAGRYQYTLAPEFAAVYGPWTVQSEWTGQFLNKAVVNGAPQGTVFYQGAYVEVLRFLTGETQFYDRETGAFGRVTPKANFRSSRDEIQGSGAWQVALRLGYLDLNNKAVQGGTVYNSTLGVNWFLNPHMKVQLNYVLENRAQPGTPTAWINGIGMRVACDF